MRCPVRVAQRSGQGRDAFETPKAATAGGRCCLVWLAAHIRTASGTALQFLLSLALIIALMLFYIVLGCFLEVTATLLLVLPILTPALCPMGVDPVHFSIVFTHNMEIGLIHPPVGLNLFVLSSVAVAPIGTVIRGILPLLHGADRHDQRRSDRRHQHSRQPVTAEQLPARWRRQQFHLHQRPGTEHAGVAAVD